jgi:hypothetical protein
LDELLDLVPKWGKRERYREKVDSSIPRPIWYYYPELSYYYPVYEVELEATMYSGELVRPIG